MTSIKKRRRCDIDLNIHTDPNLLKYSRPKIIKESNQEIEGGEWLETFFIKKNKTKIIPLYIVADKIEKVTQHVEKLARTYDYNIITMPDVYSFESLQQYIYGYIRNKQKSTLFYIKNVDVTFSVAHQQILHDKLPINEFIDTFMSQVCAPVIFGSAAHNCFTYKIKSKCKNIVLSHVESIHSKNTYQVTEHALLGTVNGKEQQLKSWDHAPLDFIHTNLTNLSLENSDWLGNCLDTLSLVDTMKNVTYESKDVMDPITECLTRKTFKYVRKCHGNLTQKPWHKLSFSSHKIQPLNLTNFCKDRYVGEDVAEFFKRTNGERYIFSTKLVESLPKTQEINHIMYKTKSIHSQKFS